MCSWEKFSKEDLEAKEVPELQALAALASNEEKPAPKLHDNDYSGQGEVIDNSEEEPLVAPAIEY